MKMKEMAGKPKSIVSLLHEEAGGSVGSSSASELPRNRRQIYVDPLLELIQRCKDFMPGPTFFGPMFVHTEKNYDAYYSLFSMLVKIEPRLMMNIVAIGTDGEQAIMKVLGAVFTDQNPSSKVLYSHEGQHST